jgi:hypothetical protein
VLQLSTDQVISNKNNQINNKYAQLHRTVLPEKPIVQTVKKKFPLPY